MIELVIDIFGHSTSVGSIGSVSVGTKHTSTSEEASVTVSSKYTSSAAIVTFYLEPVKLTYGHQAINDQSDIQTVDINIPSNQRLLKDFNSKKEELKPLEFREYYNSGVSKCYIPVNTDYDPDVVEPLESLYKFAWPGYILEKSRVYKTKNGVLGNIIGGTEKQYYENKRPYTTILEDSNRHVVNERIPSFYDSETRGFASDKHFTYIYNTPTIQVDHLRYTNSTDKKFMTTLEKYGSKPITYKLQIVNEYAYVDSLVTDNVKEEYVMTIRNSQEKTETFKYYYPRHDLVQVKVYEEKEKSNGQKEYKHYITIYEDKNYKPRNSERSYQIKDYEGMYAKYYSESLKTIKERVLNSSSLSSSDKKAVQDLFNTNKNWKVEFVYDEVERVYIKFKDLRGNSIFIKSGDHYIGEVTGKIPKTGSFKYNADNLGENGKFVLVKYTRDDYKYIDDLSKAVDTKAVHPVNETPGNGDEYIIFYYLVGNMITVEYRDKNENPIKDKYITEMPTTGINLDVPQIDMYEPIEYKHNPTYNGKDTTISTPAIKLTPEDKKIAIPNPNETDHHVIIYYESSETLKVEYRDIDGDKPIAVPPEYEITTMLKIPETGTEIPVPSVPGYEVRYYLKNDNYNGTDTTITGPNNPLNNTNPAPVPVRPNGNNQYIIIYYEKVQETSLTLTIKFVEEKVDGDYSKNIKELKQKITMGVPRNSSVPVYAPTIDAYEAVSYQNVRYQRTGRTEPIRDENGRIIGTRPITTRVTSNVMVLNSVPITLSTRIPTQITALEVIIIYRPTGEPIDPTPDPDEPTIVTPDDNKEKVYLNANQQGTEEYIVDIAVPTSEDLYVSGDVYSYRFVTDIEQVDQTKDIKVEVIQEYYVNLDDKTEKGTISTGIMDITLSYKYFDIKKADLYDLKSLHLENGAIKYYNNYDYASKTTGGYIEKEANFTIKNKPEPTIEYTNTQDVVKKVDAGEESNARVQITSGNGYKVTYEGGVYKIYIEDVDYYNYEDLAGEGKLKEQLRIEAQAIIEKCTQIKTQKLAIAMPGTEDVEIITGEKYYLPERSEALDSTKYYMPYVAGRTPLYSFLENKDLYVMEKALNKKYDSTMEGNYRLIEAIKENKELNLTELQAQNLFDKKLSVDKIITTPIRVHTPIINKVELEPSDINKESIQLIDQGVASGTDYILNLEERFTIKIENSGTHLDEKGYKGSKLYNHKGLTVNGAENDADFALWNFTSRIEPKSNNEDITKVGKLANRDSESEKDAIGPAFAEYKLIRFPYDVYLVKTDLSGNVPQLFKANVWYNLYEYVKPSTIEYEFAIPTWVKDATRYEGENGIHVLVVAENCPVETLNNVMDHPLTAKTEETNKANKEYILRTSYDTYVSGRLYDLQIRDTDDPGYMNKLKAALKGSTDANTKIAQELPIAQKGQVAAYNMGLKLGYRFYFDLKTKGISNKEITIKPNIYYVPATGSVDGHGVLSLNEGEISLFYHAKGMLNNKLTANDLNVKMKMATTHGLTNNREYTAETIAASQISGNTRNFNNQVVIGKLVEGLKLVRDTQKLPFNNIAQVANACGFGTDTNSFISSAVNSESIDDDITTKGPNDIKNSTGHWYGEYYLPASTNVYEGNVTKDQVVNKTAKQLTTGYLVVVFEEITTEDDVDAQAGYLTYDAPTLKSQWIKEGIETAMTLPNGKEATIVVPKGSMLTEAGAMAIYQVGLRANNDYEIEGTH